jgi:hypothetical protein
MRYNLPGTSEQKLPGYAVPRIWRQIIPADWAHDSLQTYSENAWQYKVGRNFNDIGYGYQWWSAKAGNHRYNLAWGHGGQQIVLLKKFNRAIVVTADLLFAQHGGGPWNHEKANLNLVADFINSLPSEVDKYFVCSCNSRPCAIVLVFPSNQRGEL